MQGARWLLPLIAGGLLDCGSPQAGGGVRVLASAGVREHAMAAARRQRTVADGVTVHLERNFDGGEVIAFGVPVPPGVLADVSTLRARAGARALPIAARELLAHRDASGARTGVRAVLIELPASALPGRALAVELEWRGAGGAPPAAATSTFGEAVSAGSAAVARTAERTIAATGGRHALVEEPPVDKVLFEGREPRVLATFPPGYLASTGILGPQLIAADAAAKGLGGLAFLSEALRDFSLSAMYLEAYPLSPHPDSVVDPIADHSGWLYDRCATFLTAYAHHGDARMLRHAYKSCSWYASKIRLSGPDAGIFSGKPERDAKYSHLRGLHAYYALTGDPAALEAGRAIAAMWEGDDLFVKPYAAGRTRGPDKLWTERLLAASLEGLYHGHRLTGERRYLDAFTRLFTTAHRHVTGDQAALAAINPGVRLPPQGCFIHTGEQQAEAEAADPWCSPWMSALLVEPLLAYEEQTGDQRVDEVFIRLGRYLRDVGSAYFTNDVLEDSFLAPSVCDDPAKGENRRRLVPLYGAGIDAQGKRRTFGEYSDYEHCADATALTAAALRALRRRGLYDQGPVPPFESEGASILALHHELAACARQAFADLTRPRRDPRVWKSADLAPGARDPAKFIEDNKIGFPVHAQQPQRRISWWFNPAMLELALLADAGVSIPELRPGRVQPERCRKR